jgi:hypothetical protein
MRVVGGTEVGDEPAPDIWEDKDNGVGRLLRAAAKHDYAEVVVIGRYPTGKITIASTVCDDDASLGLIARAYTWLSTQINAVTDEDATNT